jgi:hypothetical protein
MMNGWAGWAAGNMIDPSKIRNLGINPAKIIIVL